LGEGVNDIGTAVQEQFSAKIKIKYDGGGEGVKYWMTSFMDDPLMITDLI